MSNFVSRDDTADWDDGWSRVPHGLWTLDVPAGAKVLLGWLHSHTDAFLAKVTMNAARRAMGTSSIVTWFDALEAAGFLSIVRRPNGSPANIQLHMAPWRTLLGRDRAEIGAPTAPEPARKEEQGEDHQPSSLRSEGAIQSEGSTETPVKAKPKATAIGTEAAQAYVDRFKAEHGSPPVSTFQAIRSVATACAKRGYTSDEIVDAMIRSRVMSAKAVQDEIERGRSATEGNLGPAVPQAVLRAFVGARPWLYDKGLGGDNWMAAMQVVTRFVKGGFGVGETMLRLAVARRDARAVLYRQDVMELPFAMYRASVDRFPGELADYPDAMERAYRNRFWRAS